MSVFFAPLCVCIFGETFENYHANVTFKIISHQTYERERGRASYIGHLEETINCTHWADIGCFFDRDECGCGGVL